MSDDWAYAEWQSTGPIHRPGRQTHLVRMQHGATRLGISLETYLAHREAGESWCSWHKDWHPVEAFGADPSRSAGSVAGTCRSGATERTREIRKRAKQAAGTGGNAGRLA